MLWPVAACPALVGAGCCYWLFMAFGDRWRRLSYDELMSEKPATSEQYGTGYSSTPLAKTLGLRDGLLVWFDNVPESVDDEIAEYALDLFIASAPEDAPYASLIFIDNVDDMQAKLRELRTAIHKSGFVWACWPQNTAGSAADIDEDSIRDFALTLGYVDTKKCAIDAIWSGLKLVIRKELR